VRTYGYAAAGGHEWVTVDGRADHDAPATLVDFEPTLVFTSDGTMIRTDPSSATVTNL
jgi:hypothetical protein